MYIYMCIYICVYMSMFMSVLSINENVITRYQSSVLDVK